MELIEPTLIIKLKNTVLINALKMNQRYFMVINIRLIFS